MQLQLGVHGITGVKIKKALGNLQPAERQRRLHIFQTHRSVQCGTQPCPSEFNVSNRATSRQVPANQHRIFCFNCDIEFPIAEWRARESKLRPLRWRLRRGSAWQADGNEVYVL